MAINKNKVVTFNDLEKYAGISVDPSINLTENIISELGGLGNLFYFKGFINVSGLGVSYQKALKYVYFGYSPITSFYYDDNPGSFTGNVSAYFDDGAITTVMWPTSHFGNSTYYVVGSSPQSFSEIKKYVSNNIGSYKIVYSSIASLADDDMINDIWMTYHPIIDSSTGEPMKDENGNILYEEGEYYAETRKRGEPISL